MPERGILFKREVVRAILEGRKTMTRRLAGLEKVNASPDYWRLRGPWVHADGRSGMFFESSEGACICKPKFQPGDLLYIKESYYLVDLPGMGDCPCLLYEDEFEKYNTSDETEYEKIRYSFPVRPWDGKKKFGHFSPLFMPKWAARIWLEVTAVRAERLQDITEADAIKEGARWRDFGKCGSGFQLPGWSMEDPFPESHAYCLNTARLAFANYINKIHGGPNWNLKPENIWDRNDWVWAYTFKRI